MHHMPGTSSRRRAVREHMKELHFSDLSPGLVRVCPGLPGHGSTRWVDRVLPGYFPGRSFIKPEPVQPPGRPAGPGRAGFNNYASGDLLREHLITAIFGHLCHSYELKNMKMSMDWAGYF